MDEFYNCLYKSYRDYIIANSNYDPGFDKHYNENPTKFPFITLEKVNDMETDNSSLDKREYYDQLYFTINIYSKNKKVDGSIVSSNTINQELEKLTKDYFRKLNFKRTASLPTINMDSNIERTTIQVQCMVGNVRNNIIRN
jgi:hypothetical protein